MEEFQRKVKTVYPDKEVQFKSITNGHWALVDGLRFVNADWSEAVHVYREGWGYLGRSSDIEQA